MDNLKSFYDLKTKTMENIDKNICIESIDVEQYLKNYSKLYKWYELIEDDSSKEYQKIILENVKLLIESQKLKIKKQLENETCNLIEVSNEYSNFIVFLFFLKERYPEFKDSIIVDDMA